MQDITIDKSRSRFFISINKQGPHSFIMLGTYDKNQVQHVLCRVGKGMGLHEWEESQNGRLKAIKQHCAMLFSSINGELIDEGISRKSKNPTPISYQAYDITYAHYLDFLKILEGLQTNENEFECFKPKETHGNKVILGLSDKRIFADNDARMRVAGKIKNNVSELKLGNSCRHTAIALIEEVQHTPVSSSVSTNFFTRLPYNTELEFGKPSDNIPFYVLPFSPTHFPNSDETTKKVLKKLYQRMENMLFLDPNALTTQNKFLKLKELYLQIIEPLLEVQEAPSLDELLDDWKLKNAETISVLRKKYFFDSFFTRKSTTMKLIDEIKQDLETVPMCCGY